MILTILTAAILQAPQLQDDVVRLQSGTEVRGRILRETDDYIELRVGDGMVLGFAKSKAAAILRSVDRDGPETDESTMRSEDREQWFVLHDAGGEVVGRMHETVVRSDGETRIGQEWHFERGDQDVAMTVLETLDGADRPLSCFYHERVVGRRGEVESERVVRGVVEDGQIAVTRRSTDGSSKRRYAFADTARFPLELRHELRGASGRRVGSFEVYDPQLEQWRRVEVDAGSMRTIEHHGERLRVKIVAVDPGDERSIEWLDGAGQCVRREVNGPSLVALPVSESRAAALGDRRSQEFESSLVTEADERFALWLPNPMWRNTSTRAGEISVHAEMLDATMSLVLLDQLDSSVLLESAVDTVERWLRLAHPDLEFRSRQHTVLRDVHAVRLRGEYEVRARGGSQRRVCDVVVFSRDDGSFLSFCADAPRAGYEELAEDIERVLGRLELRREGFAPTPQGPVVGKR
ncbi:MAG: hypothetical protein KDB80_08370 [Planctomycetes bacterium]|nr:hypothetical protein [Planctomycetota bacterium]